ncbi:MAG: hypothetical protein PVI78_12225 [Anaerolineales bacterium]|jgi:hypothetical protein
MNAGTTNIRRIPVYFWAGLLILLAGEALLLAGSSFAATWFTPIMWTGYILVIDGLVHRLGGEAWLTRRRREFPLLLLASVGVWLLFEVYNLRLRNWLYFGLPDHPFLRDLGYFWSFATIIPGVFVTSELIRTLLLKRKTPPQVDKKRINLGPRWPWILIGFAMIVIPPAMPQAVAPYLFGFVWIGFIPLIDPINEMLGTTSLRSQIQGGETTTLLAFLIGGMLCGFVWETWNYQALGAQGAHWIYTLPDALRIFGWHFGKMPVLGLLGFPPFALELYIFYVCIRKLLGIERLLPEIPVSPLT